MKTLISRTGSFLMILCFIVFARVVWAGPPGPPEGGHGQGGNQQGAPIDGGLAVLILMGGGYYLWKKCRND